MWDKYARLQIAEGVKGLACDGISIVPFIAGHQGSMTSLSNYHYRWLLWMATSKQITVRDPRILIRQALLVYSKGWGIACDSFMEDI